MALSRSVGSCRSRPDHECRSGPREDNLRLSKCLVVVICSGEVLALPSPVFVLLRYYCRFGVFVLGTASLFLLGLRG